MAKSWLQDIGTLTVVQTFAHTHDRGRPGCCSRQTEKLRHSQKRNDRREKNLYS